LVCDGYTPLSPVNPGRLLPLVGGVAVVGGFAVAMHSEEPQHEKVHRSRWRPSSSSVSMSSTNCAPAHGRLEAGATSGQVRGEEGVNDEWRGVAFALAWTPPTRSEHVVTRRVAPMDTAAVTWAKRSVAVTPTPARALQTKHASNMVPRSGQAGR
jgi:hypothetical protein